MKLKALENSGELIQLGAEGATPWLKNVKAESLRQRDGDIAGAAPILLPLCFSFVFLAADLLF